MYRTDTTEHAVERRLAREARRAAREHREQMERDAFRRAYLDYAEREDSIDLGALCAAAYGG